MDYVKDYVKRAKKKVTNFKSKDKQNATATDETFYDAPEESEPQDDSGIEDLESIPAAIDFKRHVWKNHSKAPTREKQPNGVERKFFGHVGEYIEGWWSNEGQLEMLQSFQFIEQSVTIYVRQQSAGYLCTLDQEDFVARVQFSTNADGLKLPLTNIKRSLLKSMTVIKDPVSDQKLADYKSAEEHLMSLIRLRGDSTSVNVNHAEDIFQIIKSKHVSVESMIENRFVSPDLKEAAKNLQCTRNILELRSKIINNVKHNPTRDTMSAIQNVCKEIVGKHRNALYSVYPWKISTTDYIKLDSLESSMALNLGQQDLELFTNLCDLVKDPFLLKLVKHTWNKLFIQMNQLMSRNTLPSLRETAPLTHSVSFFLFKSFQEIVTDITRKADITIDKLILAENNDKWSLTTTAIPWKKTTPLNSSLEQQLRIVCKLMLHFAPGSYHSQKRLEYDFKVLKHCKPNDHANMMWPCILDAAIENLMPSEETTKHVFDQLLKGYSTFAKDSTNHESLRVITQSIAKFIVQISAHLTDSNLSSSDQMVLKQLISTIDQAVIDNKYEHFRDLVEVYNEYWDKRQSIIANLPSKFPHKPYQQHIEELSEKLMKIVINAHEKRCSIPILIDYMRSFNDFLTDLDDVDFTWFVKRQSDFNIAYLSKVDNSKESYKVLNPEKLIQETVEPPRHYIVEVIRELVDIVLNSFQKPWLVDDIISASTELLSAIRKSFMYLKEQADYESFENFKAVSMEPFSCTVQNSESSDDFKKRIGLIGESFWYLRKQDEIDIDKALGMYVKLNSSDQSIFKLTASSKKLKKCYTQYQEEFQNFLQETVNDCWEKKMEKIIDEIRNLTNSENLTELTEWNSTTKDEVLPKLLAGLAAVWSIRESRDLAKSGQSLKPHCIQIVCVFLLLGLDSDETIRKHLAQVLTGQGKSLVLGLLSAVLALTGNKVRMVCYSEYLAKRDYSDFEDFFTKFGVDGNIDYGTFEDMANEMLNPTVDGKKQSLRQLVDQRILNHEGQTTGKMAQLDVKGTVLLIDEVDVFFTDEFYGSHYGACTTIGLSGLAGIQEQIWQIVKDVHDKDAVFVKVKNVIEERVKSRDSEFIEFHKFYHKPGKYWLLNDDIVKIEYTNQSLIDEHLKMMISTAVYVSKGGKEDWYIKDFKLNEEGIVSKRNPNGLYSTHTFNNYYNSFNYFRLKVSQFDHKSHKNYGYLIIDCGRVSYAKLPEQYPLILGVSGTLTSLNDHEKTVLSQEYNINRMSDMPSFFGRSNLQFNSTLNMSCTNSEPDWVDKIYAQTNAQLELKRSVLIFFDTELEIGKFTNKYSNFLERSNTLTENTANNDKKRFVDDAGIPKTVTLATRQMGRGVDFKSSVSVEKAGGVHVIQTFFSLDIKEETQTKGRTARKNNKGSYELVLCTEHLKRDELNEDGDTSPSYQSLSRARERLAKEKGSSTAEKLKKSEEKHNTTWSFYETFFK